MTGPWSCLTPEWAAKGRGIASTLLSRDLSVIVISFMERNAREGPVFVFSFDF